MKLSITGADNDVNINELEKLVSEYSFLELALLYFPEKENKSRNPGDKWRKEYLEKIPYENRAIHLCGQSVFLEIIEENFENSDLFNELKNYSRIQININARKDVFSKDIIFKVYETLLKNEFQLILQYNESSSNWLDSFLNVTTFNNFDVLLDSSKGKGISPEKFEIPEILMKKNYNIGFAGGLNDINIEKYHKEVKKFNLSKYWLDLESGVRTNNFFDIDKAKTICYNFVK